MEMVNWRFRSSRHRRLCQSRQCKSHARGDCISRQTAYTHTATAGTWQYVVYL